MSFLRGVQTHFDGTIGDEACRQLAEKHWQLARIRGLSRSTDEMLAMVNEARAAGLTVLVSVDRFEQIEALLAGDYVEWLNEPDIQTDRYLPAADYGRELLEAAEVAARSPVGQIGGPVMSNLNQRGVDYLNGVIAACGGSLPANVFGVTHRYGHKGPLTSEFETSHRLGKPKWKWWGPFETRRAEYEWFAHTIGDGRPWMVSEGGWASAEGISEDYQAELAKQEFDLANSCGAFAYVWYQINDGPGPDAIDHFGLRRVPDYSWKPVAEIFT